MVKRMSRMIPFPIFLYSVIFFSSGVLTTFHLLVLLYSRWLLVPQALRGLVNLYNIQLTAGWIGVLVSGSGMLGISSALLVFARRRYSQYLVLANLGFGILVALIELMLFIAQYNYKVYLSFGAEGVLSLLLFLLTNGAWFLYFRNPGYVQ